MKWFASQMGLSMIEVTIAMGMLGGLGVAGMQLMKNSSEAQKTIEKKYEAVTTLSNIRSMLSEVDNCSESFRGQNPANYIPTKLRKRVDAGYEDAFVINTQLPGNIKIQNYLLNRAYPGLTSNEAVLRIRYDLGKGAITENHQNILKITFTLDPITNMIASCYALNQNDDNLWEKSIADRHNIFYNTGNVGIGTTTPTAKLTVVGSIKVGETATPCSSTTEGEVMYDRADKVMKYCNGTSWTSMAGDLVVTSFPNINCMSGSSVEMTAIACPAPRKVKSCGLRITTTTVDPDGLTCTLNLANNSCEAVRNQVGACDPMVGFDCFCQ